MTDDTIAESYRDIEKEIAAFRDRLIAEARKNISEIETRHTERLKTLEAMVRNRPAPPPVAPAPAPPPKPAPTTDKPKTTPKDLRDLLRQMDKATSTKPQTPVTQSTKPSLPDQPTITDVIGYLTKAGFKTVNKRPAGGALWVIATKTEFSDTEKVLKSKGIRCKIFANGRRRDGRPQYWVDTSNSLPD